MTIETKFHLGGTVYPISRGGFKKWIPCELCNGNGRVTILESSKEIMCPTCYGRKGKEEYVRDKWFLSPDQIGIIGKIQVEIYEPNDPDHKTEYTYMIDSTGVGSGRIWSQDDLFKTVEEAQIECDKRNELVHSENIISL